MQVNFLSLAWVWFCEECLHIYLWLNAQLLFSTNQHSHVAVVNVFLTNVPSHQACYWSHGQLTNGSLRTKTVSLRPSLLLEMWQMKKSVCNDTLTFRLFRKSEIFITKLAATLWWFTAGGAICIAVRQLSQTWKLRHYDVIDDAITRKL